MTNNGSMMHEVPACWSCWSMTTARSESSLSLSEQRNHREKISPPAGTTDPGCRLDDLGDTGSRRVRSSSWPGTFGVSISTALISVPTIRQSPDDQRTAIQVEPADTSIDRVVQCLIIAPHHRRFTKAAIRDDLDRITFHASAPVVAPAVPPPWRVGHATRSALVCMWPPTGWPSRSPLAPRHRHGCVRIL